MKKYDDKQLSAYLDSELSVTETEKLESHLTSTQLKYLQREKKLEERITEKLNSGKECPPEVWQDVLNQVQKNNSRVRLTVLSVIVAAAAVLTIAFTVDFNDYGPNVPSTVAELQSMSQTEASLDGINGFLAGKNINLKLNELPQGYHKKEVIGAGVEIIAGDEIVTLLFQCCGEPVKVYVLPRDSAAEKKVHDHDSDWKDGVKGQTRMGNYRLAVVSKHGGVDILSAITTS